MNLKLKALVSELEIKIDNHNKDFASQEFAFKQQIEVLTRSSSNNRGGSIAYIPSTEIVHQATMDIDQLKSKVERIKNNSTHISKMDINLGAVKDMNLTTLPVTTYKNLSSTHTINGTQPNLRNTTTSTYTPNITNISQGPTQTVYADSNYRNTAPTNRLSQSTTNFNNGVATGTSGVQYSKDYVKNNTFNKITPTQYTSSTVNKPANTQYTTVEKSAPTQYTSSTYSKPANTQYTTVERSAPTQYTSSTVNKPANTQYTTVEKSAPTQYTSSTVNKPLNTQYTTVEKSAPTQYTSSQINTSTNPQYSSSINKSAPTQYTSSTSKITNNGGITNVTPIGGKTTTTDQRASNIYRNSNVNLTNGQPIIVENVSDKILKKKQSKVVILDPSENSSNSNSINIVNSQGNDSRDISVNNSTKK
jgi:hypothetical protein